MLRLPLTRNDSLAPPALACWSAATSTGAAAESDGAPCAASTGMAAVASSVGLGVLAAFALLAGTALAGPALAGGTAPFLPAPRLKPPGAPPRPPAKPPRPAPPPAPPKFPPPPRPPPANPPLPAFAANVPICRVKSILVGLDAICTSRRCGAKPNMATSMVHVPGVMLASLNSPLVSVRVVRMRSP